MSTTGAPGRVLTVLAATADAVQFSTTGRAVWVSETRLINAMPGVIKWGHAWVAGNALDESDIGALRAAIVLARKDDAS